MSRFSRQITSYWHQTGAVIRNEFRTIFTDKGVILILVFALLIYATVYSLAYGSQVLRNVPIGVVDECRTPTSRALINAFNAGPNTYVAYTPTSMEEARELFHARKIYGVVYIPSDYERCLYGGEQANVAIYCDASYFLMYRQVFQEVVTSIGHTGAMVEFQRLIAKGANIPQAQATTQPVIYQSHNLFNPYLGYGTFVMPAIIMVIIQQTMLIGIGMIGGTWREFGLYHKLCPPGRRRMSTIPIVIGRSLVYALIYAVKGFPTGSSTSGSSFPAATASTDSSAYRPWAPRPPRSSPKSNGSSSSRSSTADWPASASIRSSGVRSRRRTDNGRAETAEPDDCRRLPEPPAGPARETRRRPYIPKQPGGKPGCFVSVDAATPHQWKCIGGGGAPGPGRREERSMPS